MLVAISLASIMAVILANVSNDTQKNIKDQNTAQYQKRVMTAAASWLKDNYVTAQAAATATVPYKLTVPTLVAAKYLPTGFTATNPYNQTTCILTLQPSVNKLETVVVTEGGVDIPQGRIPTIANLIGADGGFIQTDNVTAQGSFGGWSRNISTFLTDNCSGTQAKKNHLAGALFLDGSNVLNDYLYRSAVPGHPEANTMTTPLIINSVKAVGDPCTTTGTLTTAVDGVVLTCQAGQYQQQGSAYWKDPVATFATLPVCNAASVNQTRIVQTPTVGTGQRAYSCNGAGTWVALGVDNSGSITMLGTATAGKLRVTDTVTEFAACTPNGLIAKNTVGLLLSCQSGTWKKAQSGAPLIGNSQVMVLPAGTTYTVQVDATYFSCVDVATYLYLDGVLIKGYGAAGGDTEGCDQNTLHAVVYNVTGASHTFSLSQPSYQDYNWQAYPN